MIPELIGLYIFARYVAGLGMMMGCVEHVHLKAFPLAIEHVHTSDCQSLHHEYVSHSEQHAQLVQRIGPMANYQPSQTETDEGEY